ncbi:MAG: hypothetical protein FJW36_01355 [Acidobacteria bacterium]|nr:hypothetical protein [Acidobacteriota bacterium]
MALIKDQPISCLTDWMAFDSKLSILSEQESTSIESKSRLAQNEIETQVTSFLLRQSGLSESASRQLLDKVVVTEPLSRWHSLLTLSLFYVDVASMQNSALHREQAKYYEAKAKEASDQLFEVGVGVVYQPIAKAPVPLVVISAGSNPSRFLRGRIRLVDIDGAVGTLSEEFLVDMTSGETAELSVDSLPPRVLGWILFLGESSESLRESIISPVPAGTARSITPDMPNPAAPLVRKSAQSPDRFIRYTTELWR